MNTLKKANMSKEDTLKKESQSQQQDLSDIQVNNVSKYERHEVENTPFIILEEPQDKYESKYWVVIGKYKVSELGHETLMEAIEDAQTITWDRIVQVISCMIDIKEKLG